MLSLFFLLLAGTVYAKQPNFVVILTDDQDVTLGGMNPMKNVRRFIGERGFTFTNAENTLRVSRNLSTRNGLEPFVSSPICCPSRASFLTGLYVHNHETRNNSVVGGCYGARWKDVENHTFATALSDAGYSTFYAGKYMNQYGVNDSMSTVPPGWSEWHGLVGNSVYYNYTMSNNGVPTRSNDLYLTDIIRDLSISFIEHQNSQPFLMVLAPPAPHQPFTPAPRHKDAFENVTVPRTPHFNIAVEDKHWLLRMPPSPLPETMLPELDRVFRSRWQTLLAVDEMVADVVGALEIKGLMENTYVLYTSDNGYHIGQFSQIYDKRQPYESDIRVPLLISGPGIQPNVTSEQPVLNIDLAPTIIQLAGLKVPDSMDGKPLILAANQSVTSRIMLVEYSGEARKKTVDPTCPWKYDSAHLSQCLPMYDCKCQDSKNNTYNCIRYVGTDFNYKYCEFNDEQRFTEIYDLNRDPYELKNIVAETLPAFKYWYSRILSRMVKCKGAKECNVSISSLTSDA